MAEGEKVGGRLGRVVDIIDHPIVFALAITLMVVPIMALLTVLFTWAGLPGPRSLVQTP